MNVTKVTTNTTKPKDEILPPSDDQLKSELDYIRAKKSTQELLEKGLISKKQYDDLLEIHVLTFKPEVAQLL